MPIPTTLAELQRLITNLIPESLHLDYKQSESLRRKNTDEVSKDVSAFANADGGVIIYGIVEADHVPVRIDDGVDETVFNRERLENLITSNISPRIEGVRIHPVPLPSGDVAIGEKNFPAGRQRNHGGNRRRAGGHANTQ